MPPLQTERTPRAERTARHPAFAVHVCLCHGWISFSRPPERQPPLPPRVSYWFRNWSCYVVVLSRGLYVLLYFFFFFFYPIHYHDNRRRRHKRACSWLVDTAALALAHTPLTRARSPLRLEIFPYARESGPRTCVVRSFPENHQRFRFSFFFFLLTDSVVVIRWICDIITQIPKWAPRKQIQFTGRSSASWARHRLSYSAVSITITIISILFSCGNHLLYARARRPKHATFSVLFLQEKKKCNILRFFARRHDGGGGGGRTSRSMAAIARIDFFFYSAPFGRKRRYRRNVENARRTAAVKRRLRPPPHPPGLRW